MKKRNRVPRRDVLLLLVPCDNAVTIRDGSCFLDRELRVAYAEPWSGPTGEATATVAPPVSGHLEFEGV
jgi:hypothetical protein